GYLLPPCIHSFENEGIETSVSLHVIAMGRATEESGQDHTHVPTRESNVKWFGHDNRAPLGHGARRRVLLANIGFLGSLHEPPVALLQRCFDLGDLPVKLAATRAVARVDVRS